MKKTLSLKNNSWLIWIVGLVAVSVAAGWFLSQYMRNIAKREIIEENNTSINILSTLLKTEFSKIEGAVKTFAGSPWIAPALITKARGDIERADSALVRYNASVDATVSYLMDSAGIIIASSNRNNQDSFVGHSCAFRPYFKEAVLGNAFSYLATGIISQKNGFYASAPVMDGHKNILGVLVMKKELHDIEAYMRKYHYCFLIDPNGIVFLSSKPDMVLKSLWQVNREIEKKLLASKQFGERPFNAVMGREIADGMYATIAGKGVVVSRKQIDIEGWSIVLMEPIDRINIYRLAGFLIAGFIFVLIAIPLIINYKTNRLMEMVRQSEESKSLFLHAAGEGMLGVDTTGQLTFINSAALRMLGFTEGELVGQQAHGLIHHSRKDGSNYPVEDCPLYDSYTNATEIYSKEEIFWRKDGSSFPVEYSSMPIIRDGLVIGAVVTFNDITNRKQAEQALRDSEEKFRKITASAWDAIIMMNDDGIIIYWNEAAEKIFGYTHDEAVGKELHPLIVPQKYYQSFTKGLEHFKKTGQGDAIGKTLELSGLRKGGTEFPIEISLSSAYLQGKWSAIGIVRDITDRKEADVLFRESVDLFRVAIEEANDGVTINSGDRHVYVNQKFLDIFGYERQEDIVGKPVTIIVHPDDQEMVLENVRKRRAGEPVPSKYEFKGIRKNGAVLFIEVSVAKIKYGGKTASLAYLRDMTERRHMEEQLRDISLTDELTGLHNRRGFMTLAQQQIKITERAKKGMLLFFADVDKFKQINDTLGHQEGDRALIEVATILKEIFRKSDIIGRMGGDEFAILAINATAETGDALLKRLDNYLDNCSRLEGRNYALSLSMGMAQYDPENPCSLDELMAQADTLMYEEKSKKQQ